MSWSDRMSEEKTIEKIDFQAEVQQLLNLVIHSLYSEREVFLRELISNASDACGRLRFESLTNPDMLEVEHTPSVELEVAKRGRRITIRDNGIGMTREEVAENIGTIARSGTKRFVEALTGEETEDTNLIGQFGVGFYSVFMVADNVVLRTRKAGAPKDQGVVWESDGVSGYTIDEESIENHGTEIIITLRKDAKYFLDGTNVSDIIRKYADHISVPIRLKADTPAKKKKEQDDQPADESTVEADDGWEMVNDGSALWTRARKDISAEEYDNFYKSLTSDEEEPLVRLHTQVEGQTEYSALLFIPPRAPFDLWDQERQRGIKLYVRRVFIADDTKNLMPAYLRFVRGIIDSDDLPLNVSREFLQKNRKIERIRNGVVKKILGELKRIAKKDSEKYQTFWNQFGRAFKEGVTEDTDKRNRQSIADLLRFATTRSEGSEQTESLQQYVDRMHEKQDAIYYIAADSHASAEGSPHLEVFNKHDVEVLLMTDPIDEWVVMQLTEYQDKPLKSIARGDLSLDWLESEEKAEEAADDEVSDLIGKLAEALQGRIMEVKVTSRLTDSPACLVSYEFGHSRNMHRILKAAGQQSFEVPPVMEINPDHPIIKNLIDSDDDLEDWAHVLFDQASLSEGSALDNPADYVRRINKLLSGTISEKSSIILPS